MENCGATGALLLPVAVGAANMEPAGGAGGYAGVNGLIAFLPLVLVHLFGAFGGALLLLLTAAGNIFPGSAFPADVAGGRAFWGWLVDGRAFFCANEEGMC